MRLPVPAVSNPLGESNATNPVASMKNMLDLRVFSKVMLRVSFHIVLSFIPFLVAQHIFDL